MEGVDISHDKLQERRQRFASHLKNNRYLEMTAARPKLQEMYIAQGKMADPKQTYQLNEAVKFIPECQDMCPEYEREEREYTSFLEPFEKIPGTERVDHAKAVKRYKRSAAGDPPPLPCDVRPPDRTLDYLFHDLIRTHGIRETHAFVRDRARAIRNDLTLQNYRGVESVILHERIARYHIMCSNVLCGEKGFVMQQEVEQLKKTLLSLMEFYAEMAEKDIHMPNEAEFQAYYILTFPWNNSLVSKMEEELDPKIFFDPKVQLALEIRFLMTRRNDQKRPSVDGSLNHYARLFSILRMPSTSYLFACCVHIHFVDIRRSALRAMQKSYYINEESSSGISLEEVQHYLGFEDKDQCIEFLSHYFIEVNTDIVPNVAYIGRLVKTDKNGKKAPEFPKYPYSIIPDNFPAQRSNLVERKREGLTYLEILDGKFTGLSHKSSINLPSLASPTKPKKYVESPRSALTPKFVISQLKTAATPVTQVKSTQMTPNTPAFSFLNPTTNGNLVGNGNFSFLGNQPKPTIEAVKSNLSDIPLKLEFPPSGPSFRKGTSESERTTKKHNTFQDELQPAVLKVRSPVKLNGVVEKLKSPTKKVDLSKLENFCFNDLVNENIKPVAKEALKEASAKRSARMDNAAFIFDSLVDEILLEVASERLEAVSTVSQWRQAIENVSEELIYDEIYSAASQAWAEIEFRKIQLQNAAKLHFKKWNDLLKARQFKRMKKDILGKRMMGYIKQSSLHTSVDLPLSKSPQKLSKLAGVDMQLLQLAQEMAEKRKIWYKPLNFEEELFPLLNSRLSPAYKLAICSVTEEISPGTLDWFTDSWFTAKLSQSQYYCENGLQTLTDINSRNNDGEPIRLLIQQLNPAALESFPDQYNANSVLSGINGGIFQTRYVSDDLIWQQEHYWASLVNRLTVYLEAMPLGARIPLLVTYWPRKELPLHSFKEFFHKALSSIPSSLSSRITKIHFASFKISPDSYDSETASITLVENLAWLIENASTETVLSTGILNHIPKSISILEWSFRKLSDFIPMNAKHVPSAHVEVANVIISIFNHFQEFLVTCVTDKELLLVAFPGKEFAPLNLTWNTPETFQKLVSMTKECQLPMMPLCPLDQPNVDNIINLYQVYIDLLLGMPRATAQTFNSLKSIMKSFKKTKTIDIADFFFGVTNAVLDLFVTITELQVRPFLPSSINEEAFNTKIHTILSTFTKSNPFKDLEPKHQISHQSNPILQTTLVSEAKKRLQEAMHSANITLQERKRKSQHLYE